MRLYFLWGLIASFILVVVLFVLMILALRKNWNHSNRTVISYLTPIVLVILLLYLSLSQFVPRVFDAVQIVYGQFASTVETLSDEDIKYNYIKTNDSVYYFPPTRFKDLNPGKYQIYYTERTNYVMNIIFVGESENANTSSSHASP